MMIRAAAFVLATMCAGMYLRRSSGSPVRMVLETTSVEPPAAATAKVVEQSSLDVLERYQQCVDAIMTGKSSAGCEKKSPPDRMLYIVIGDSTARKHAKAVNEEFPDLKFNGSKIAFPTSAKGTYKLSGKKVEVMVAMFSGLRHDRLQEDLLSKIQDHVDDVGVEPSVVVFSGAGLHECLAAGRNKNPFWLQLRKIKAGDLRLPKWKTGAVAMKDYHRLEGHCTLSVLKELRLAFPKTTFLWRPLASPVTLFMGSQYEKLDKKSCRRMDRWRKMSHACGDTYAWHMQLKPKLREIGFGVLDYTAVYPEKCGLADAIHLSNECHAMMVKRSMKVSQLVVPDPELYLDRNEIKAEMAMSCPLDRKLEKLKDIMPATPEEVTVLQFNDKQWHNVRCANFLNKTAYDPLTGEYFKPKNRNKLNKIHEGYEFRTLTAGDKTNLAYSLRSIGIASLSGYTARPVFASEDTPKVGSPTKTACYCRNVEELVQLAF